MMEGPISGSVVVASTFSKLAAFMIIQTFFVTAISGGLMEEIKNIIDDPLSAIDLLANSLPGQATLFMQLSFVGTVIFIAMENLRVLALGMALIRRCVGPRLTEKQRQTTFLGIRPLADPLDFQFEDNMSQICVLYFMIIFVRVVRTIFLIPCFASSGELSDKPLLLSHLLTMIWHLSIPRSTKQLLPSPPLFLDFPF